MKGNNIRNHCIQSIYHQSKRGWLLNIFLKCILWFLAHLQAPAHRQAPAHWQDPAHWQAPLAHLQAPAHWQATSESSSSFTSSGS